MEEFLQGTVDICKLNLRDRSVDIFFNKKFECCRFILNDYGFVNGTFSVFTRDYKNL